MFVGMGLRAGKAMVLLAVRIATVVAVALMMLAATRAQATPTTACGVLRYHGAHWSLGERWRITDSEPRCAEARRIIRDDFSGKGTYHGGKDVAESYWMVGGWRCIGPETRLVSCTRDTQRIAGYELRAAPGSARRSHHTSNPRNRALKSLLRRVPLAKAKSLLSQDVAPFLAEVRARGEQEEADGEERRGPFQWSVSQPSCSTKTTPEAEIICKETAGLQYNTVGQSATPVNVCETKPGYYSPGECPQYEYPEVLVPGGKEERLMLLTISQGGVANPLKPEADAALCGHLEGAVRRGSGEWEITGESGPECNVTV